MTQIATPPNPVFRPTPSFMLRATVDGVGEGDSRLGEEALDHRRPPLSGRSSQPLMATPPGPGPAMAVTPDWASGGTLVAPVPL